MADKSNEVKEFYDYATRVNSPVALEATEKMFPTSNVRLILGLETFYDPTEVIKILVDELSTANSREALGGYFDHLIDDEVLQRSLIAYCGQDLGTKQAHEDDD